MPEEREVPDWYITMKVAERAHVPAHKLDGLPDEPYVHYWWKLRYIEAMNREAKAQETLEKHRNMKANKKSLI